MDILDRISLLLGNREQKELTKHLGLNSVAFSEWKSGKSKSYRKYLIEIADFFNVSIDYLVYGKEKASLNNSFSDDEKKLLHMYSLLSDMEKGEILGELKAITKNRNNITRNENIQTAKAVARSFDNHPPETITDDFSELFNAPDATNKYQK